MNAHVYTKLLLIIYCILHLSFSTQEDAQEEDLEAQDLQLDERILEAKRRWDAGMELHRLLESRISQHLQSIRG